MMHRKSHIALLSCSTAILLALSAAPSAFALPEGGQVTHGSANITQSGKKLDIHQHTNRAVIDWRKFNIAPDEATQFHQPSKNATVLNRINDPNPSQILGKLQANGNVVLINPNGIFFGKNAVVDVNGLVAATADTDSAAFMRGGTIDFNTPGNPNAKIENAGHITAREAGLVGLVAPVVENSGIIEAKLGRVELASGDAATVDFYGDGLVKIRVQEELSQQIIRNTGTIEGGTIALTAAAGKNIVNSLIEVKGELKAATVEQQDGKIIIAAAGSNAVEGNIAAEKGVKSGHSTVMVDAKLAAKDAGSITITGDKIALLKDTTITANGKSTGGNIKIGGDYQGKGTTAAATDVFVEKGAKIHADATEGGKGGKVIIWSDKDTAFGGFISATGFTEGGFAEVSGKQWLDFQGVADLRAQSGKAGTLLLDPTNITITGSDSVPALVWNGTQFADSTSNRNSANLSVTTLQGQLNLSNVTVTTASSGGSAGTLTVSSAIEWNSPYSLTLFANDYMQVNANITYKGNSDVGLTLQANNYIRLDNGADITVDTGSGATGSLNVTLNSDRDGNSTGSIRLDEDSDIITNGGDIIMGGGGNPLAGYAWGTSTQNDGIDLKENNILDAGGGDIILRGHGWNNNNTSTVVGIMANGSHIRTNDSGSITMDGIGGNGGTFATTHHLHGINIENNSLIEVENGSILMNGAGGVRGNFSTGDNSNGIYITESIIRSNATSPTTGTISLTGTGGFMNSSMEGIRLYEDASILSGYADITLNGTGATAGMLESKARGILVEDGSTIASTGTGANAASISLTGVAGNAAQSDNHGIVIQSATSDTGISSVDGDISLHGTAFHTLVNGIMLFGNGCNGCSNYVWSTGAGDVTLTGVNSGIGSSSVLLSSTGGTNPLQYIGHSSGTGTVSIIGDTYTHINNSYIRSGGDVVIRPRSNGATIGIGDSVLGQSLSIKDNIITSITYGGTLWLGGDSTWNNSGNVTYNYNGTFNGNVNFMSGADMLITGGAMTKNGGAASVDWNILADGNITASGSSDITATSGAVNLTLNADYDESGAGGITLGAGSNYALNGGDVTLRGQSLALDATSSINTTGHALITTAQAGTSIVVGTGAGALSISDVELARFTGNMASLTIGDAGSGNMIINSGYTFSDAVRFISGGDVTINGQITASDGGTALEIVAGDDIHNLHGAGVFNLTGGGRFLTWSDSPAEDTGALHFANSNVVHYGRDYGDTVTETGSVRNYSSIPTLTVTADNKNVQYGSAAPAYTYTITGWNAGDEVNDTITGSATFDSAYTSTDNAGSTFTISHLLDNLASALGYDITFADGTLTVIKRDITAVVNSASRQYGSANPTLDYTDVVWTNLANGQNGSVLDTVNLTFAGTANATANAGTTHAINLAVSDGNYNLASFTAGTLTIDKALLTVTADDISINQGGTPGFTASYAGFKNGQNASVFTTPVSFNDTAPDYNTPGGYVITPFGAAATNYSLAYVNGALTINATGSGGGGSGGSGGSGGGGSGTGGTPPAKEGKALDMIENSRTPTLPASKHGFMPSHIIQLFDANNGQYVAGLPVSAIDTIVLDNYRLKAVEAAPESKKND